MIYKGYVLEHGEVYDSKLGWYHFGVIKNIENDDFTCKGQTIEELESNFHHLVDFYFDELQSLTEVVSVDLTQDLSLILKEIAESRNISIEEAFTVIAIDSLGGLKQ